MDTNMKYGSAPHATKQRANSRAASSNSDASTASTKQKSGSINSRFDTLPHHATFYSKSASSKAKSIKNAPQSLENSATTSETDSDEETKGNSTADIHPPTTLHRTHLHDSFRSKYSVETIIKVQSFSNAETLPLLREKPALSTVSTRFELYKLIQLASPITFTYILESLPAIISLLLVSHMPCTPTQEYLDGVALSTMFINLTAITFGFGLATAMDTLCSQAFGANQCLKMGVYLQTGMLLLGCMLLPIVLVNYYTAECLMWLGQPPNIALLAGQFSRLSLPGIPCLYLYELVKKLLQAQNIVKPMVSIAILSNVVHITLGVYLTQCTALGFAGAAIARTVASAFLLFALGPYFWSCPQLIKTWWPGWDLRLAVREIGPFLKLGIPGMMMILMEWWSFEIMAIIVGVLPNSVAAISVHSIMVNISTLTFNIYLGISVACNVRVGNCMGANMPRHAKMVANLSLALSLAVSIVMAGLIFVFRTFLSQAFITEPATVDLLYHALLLLLPYQLSDAVNAVLQGVFRGIGQQTLGACINFVVYFILGLPLGTYLAFTFGYGVSGLWIGSNIGMFCGILLALIQIHRTNWKLLSDAAGARSAD
uniref:Multidrug/Oligosaccharidyllipid/Polysaccharide (MOP) Flippase Superfamily putative n=1 Tax=Albugo laibachii Nc14 TaxID=890382 RepID=F0WM21_9STRA|nr:Multidrug/Oligosaccharidyllipid/Polysaccharide (MOP) Flippase Superfamily putative [Albugo laibachii Nc14]|eukprot:CCA22348.1 Multidrug/Oligosaccharidyllipid/Polysaccharide (MOP) Flippase Superfamily putative [Albugo laibachii Nc14]